MNLYQRKPVHLKCPKCGHDFSTNTNKIVVERQQYKKLHSSLLKKRSELIAKGLTKKSPEVKRLDEKIEDCRMTLQALNNLNRNLSENMEIEKNKVFYKLVKQEIGEERTVELMIEAEDSLVYRDYDMAVQRHTNFDGA